MISSFPFAVANPTKYARSSSLTQRLVKKPGRAIQIMMAEVGLTQAYSSGFGKHTAFLLTALSASHSVFAGRE